MEQLDVARLRAPENWNEVLAVANELLEEEHDFKTLVVDTIDWLSPILYAKVVESSPITRRGPARNIEEVGGGYGTGYSIAAGEWRYFTSKLDELRLKRGMNIVLLGHTQIRTMQNPTGGDYSQFVPRISKAEAGVLKEWVDAVLFATYEFEVEAPESDKVTARAKAVASGRRVVYTQFGGGFEAGNRYGIQAVLPLDFEAFAAAAGILSAPELIYKIEALCEGKEWGEKALAASAAAGNDTAKLLSVLKRATDLSQNG